MTGLAEKARSAWEAFWFPPASARNVAAARMLFAGHALWIVLSRDLPALSALPAEFWAGMPAGTRWRYLVSPGHPGLETALEVVAVAALAGAMVGLWSRACCFVAGLLLYHLAPLESLFWTPSPWPKGLTLSVTALVALSASRCGDAWSVDRLRPGTREDAASWEYAWPVRLLQLFLCEAYLLSAFAKLFESGPEWASPANMRAWLLLATQDDQLAAFRSLGPWIADRPLLCLLMGALALGLDLAFVAALVSRRARRWLVPAAVLFHLGIVFTLNYVFLYLPLLLVFVDWEAVSRGRDGVKGASGVLALG